MHARSVMSVTLGLSIALLTRISFCAEPELPPVPELTVQVAKAAPVIDGDLADACWQQAPAVSNMYIFQGKGKTSDAQTVKVVRDDEWLYFAFEIKLPFPQAIRSTATTHDGPIAADDCVEVMLDPGTSGELYFHYMLTSGNVRGERRCTLQGESKDMLWNMPWRSATKITKTGWQAEMAIPWKPLDEQGKLGKTTLNFYVSRIPVILNDAGCPISSTMEQMSWSAVRRGFHDPSRFGALKGIEALTPKEPFLVSMGDIKTGGYVTDEQGQFAYEVSGSVRGFTPRNGRVMLALEDKPVAGQGETVRRELELKGTDAVPFTIRMPVKVLAGRTAELSLRDPVTGEFLQTDIIRGMSSLMRTYARYSYYTTEKNAGVVCEIGLPESELKKARLVAKDKAGKTLAEDKDLRPRTIVPVPAMNLAVGQHQVAIELQSKTGEIMLSQETILLKRAPRPGCEWKIDRADKVILNNGKPFFVFGLMLAEGTTMAEENFIKDIADCGFNTIVPFLQDPFDKIGDLLEMSKKYDFKVIEFPTIWQKKLTPEQEAQFKAVAPEKQWDWKLDNIYMPGVRQLMNHPNLMAWYLWDEPGRNPDPRLLRYYDKINETDGYHPTEILHIPPVPEGDEFSNNCDILGIDPYWIPGSGPGVYGNPNSVGKETWGARKRGDRDLKLVWVTPAAERYSAFRFRLFSEREQRVQTYLALIHGAKGMLFWCGPFQHQATYDTFARLNKEMKTLGAACVAPDLEQHVKCTPVAFDPANNVFPDVQVSLKRNPAGGYIMLAANWRGYPVEVSYKLSILGKSGKIRQCFEKDAVCTVKDGSFTDTLAAMDTRAYVIDGPSELTAPVEIAVDIKARPEKTDPFYTKIADCYITTPGKKNGIFNSGFEECSIPGYPDYYTQFQFRTKRGDRLGSGLGKGYRIGDTRADCGVSVDTANPHEGKACLRLTGKVGFTVEQISLKMDPPGPCTLSAWVRGDGTNASIRFNGKAYPLTADWQRIAQTNVASSLRAVSVDGGSASNTVWIDAMQFEKGQVATEYER